LISKLTAIKIS